MTFRAALLALVAAACTGGKSVGETATTETAASTTTTSTGSGTTSACNYAATWQGVQDFFVVNCDRCHADAYGLGHLDLRAAVEDDVNAGGGVIVQPGDAEASDLWRDIAWESLLPMPNDIPSELPEAEICNVRDWIDAGASLE